MVHVSGGTFSGGGEWRDGCQLVSTDHSRRLGRVVLDAPDSVSSGRANGQLRSWLGIDDGMDSFFFGLRVRARITETKEAVQILTPAHTQSPLPAGYNWVMVKEGHTPQFQFTLRQ